MKHMIQGSTWILSFVTSQGIFSTQTRIKSVEEYLGARTWLDMCSYGHRRTPTVTYSKVIVHYLAPFEIPMIKVDHTSRLPPETIIDFSINATDRRLKLTHSSVLLLSRLQSPYTCHILFVAYSAPFQV
jgi:hypothetical protein